MKITDKKETQKKERKKKKEKTGEDKGVTQAIGKGWELNDFVVHLS